MKSALLTLLCLAFTGCQSARFHWGSGMIARSCEMVKLTAVYPDGAREQLGSNWQRCFAVDQYTRCSTYTLTIWPTGQAMPTRNQLGKWTCPAGVEPPRMNFDHLLSPYSSTGPDGSLLVQFEDR